MSTVTTWCLKPKGKAELILFPLSLAKMHGTLSHPTVRATAASTVQSMRRAVGVPWAPAAPSASSPLRSRSVRPARRHTCRSTASSGRPTSTAFKAEVSSETHDGEKVPQSAAKGQTP
ncbi:hypothetical protein OJAV_G00079270 [Oryzias javanicus]|uniref:Uncharacterized protein n=1 Tax=Oryzias javanicus TaxID=123683 RepID=A0A3S2PBR2_ORYJA|nr:hypothetical protein OJAV_G00079270 [Oryzias javanicus]